MSFISITGTIKWDIFVFYIVSGVIFVTVICVIGGCQLESLSISRVIDHMTSYNTSTLIG